MRKIAPLLAALLMCGSVMAQDVWRCGSHYADSPCPGGRRVEVADERSPGQQAAAADVAARQEQLASRLVAERTAREREALRQGGGLMAIGPFAKPQAVRTKVSKRAPAHRQKQHQPATPDTFRAIGPSSPHAPG